VETRFDRETISRKLRVSLSLGLLAGMLIGVGRAVLFVTHEQYPTTELLALWPELLFTPLNHAVFFSLAASLVFAVAWMLFDRTAHLAVAFSVVAIPFFLLAYFLNKQFLPGLREIKSLAGNGALATLFLACGWVVFTKWISRWRLQGKFLNRATIIVLVVVTAAFYVFYFLQSKDSRLTASSETPDADFFALFALEGDSLSAIRAAVGEKKYSAARAALFEHLKRRRGQHAERLEQIIGNPDAAAVIAKADSVLQRSFTFWGVSRELPQHIDWRQNPTKDRVWLFTLNQQKWLAEIAGSYLMTGDEKYARDFAVILESWFQQNELPNWKNERDPVWRLMETSIRGANWLDAFFAFLSSESLSDDLKIKLLAALHDHAQFLYYFRSPQRNHLLRESYGLLQIGVLLPEFKMARQWERMAVARLTKAVEEDVYPDGGYSEGSTYYHRFAMRVLQEIDDFCQAHGVALPEVMTSRLEGMYDFLLYVSRPDGAMPQINDGFYSRDLRELFAAPAKEFSRRDFEFFNTSGEAGEAPRHTSMGFPYSGVYVMRSDWTNEARYCVLDAGLYGSAHGHEDKLSFELHAFGQPFIVEAGTYTYVYDDWHKYFESSLAHNTIVVDGKGQLRHVNKANWTHSPLKKLPNTWVSTSDFDYVEAVYDEGYAEKKESIDRSVHHSRRILFIKPDYWILWDVLAGTGKHRFDQLFHFALMNVEIDDSSKIVRTENQNGANLFIYPLLPGQVSLKKVDGQINPIQGWISTAYGQKEPAPAIIYSQVAQTPAVFLCALIPVANSLPQLFDVTMMPVMHEQQTLPVDRAVALCIRNSEWADYISLAPRLDGRKNFGDYSTMQQLQFLRVTNAGDTIKKFEADLSLSESN
jgi:hypothetical protein